jgi:hypothetical protein
VVEGGGPLCYYIHTVSLSILRCSKLRPLLGSPPRTQMAAETEHDVVTGNKVLQLQGTLLKGANQKVLIMPSIGRHWKIKNVQEVREDKKRTRCATLTSCGLRSATRRIRRALHIGHIHARMIISFTELRRYGEHCLGIGREARGY